MDQDPELYDDEFDEEDDKDSFDAYLKERDISASEYDAMDEEDQATLHFDWGANWTEEEYDKFAF